MSGFNKVIDLSHPLRPGREARRLEIEELPATDITGASPEEGGISCIGS